MGQAKAALPFGQDGRNRFVAGGQNAPRGRCPTVVVVAGAHIDAVRRGDAGARAARARRRTSGWEQGQLSSLLAGLDAIDDPLLEAALVTLVDVPLVHAVNGGGGDRGVARDARADRAAGDPSTSLRAGGPRHGHPVIFDRSVFADLRAADPAIGAKAVFATSIAIASERGSQRRRRVRGHRYAGRLRIGIES